MHVLIVGNSNTGKTKLAQIFAEQHAATGGNVVVFDPLRANGWPNSAKKYSDPETFLSEINEITNAMVFVEEAKDLYNFDTKEAQRLAYQRRHQGLLVFFIAQRAYMLPPNARNQCSKVFSFRQQLSDAKILKDEYHPELIKTPDLEDIHFIATVGKSAVSGKLEFSDTGNSYSTF